MQSMSLMAASEESAATTMPTITGPSVSEVSIPPVTRSLTCSTTEPRIAGIDIRNEKRAASSRSTPRRSPPEIVLPERETPGKIAKAWKQPITAASA